MGVGHEVTASEIAAVAAHAAFGHRLVTNVHRGLVAEAIVASALRPTWEWCSADYAAWDFQREDGLRLEVKQAASRQSWHEPTDPASRISFDIRERKGRWEGTDWLADVRRWAQVYVFAHHRDMSEEADHRDPRQWVFYVVFERTLPSQNVISLSRIKLLTRPCSINELAETVKQVSSGCELQPLLR